MKLFFHFPPQRQLIQFTLLYLKYESPIVLVCDETLISPSVLMKFLMILVFVFEVITN